MQKLLIPKKRILPEEKLIVKNEKGEILYKVEQVKSFMNKRTYTVSNEKNDKVGEIIKKPNNDSTNVWNLPNYNIHADDWKKVSIIKSMANFRSFYEINGEGLTIQGDWLSDYFEINRNDKKVAIINKTSTDNQAVFELENLNESLETLIVCLVVAISFIQCWEFIKD